MRGISRQILLLVLFAALLCIGIPNAQAFEPILFGQEGAFLKIDLQGQLYGVWRNTGSGPNGTSETTDLFFRRNRLTFWGHGTDKYGFIVQLEYVGAERIQDLYVSDQPGKDFSVLDAYFMADFSNSFRIYAGKQKVQLTRENLEDCFVPLSIDRSLFIYTPFNHSRDTGVVVWGNIPEAKMQYRFEVSKGQDSKDAPKSTLLYTGRVHVSLLDPEYAYGYKGTYLGKEKVLTFGAGAQYQPDAVYSDVANHTDAKGYTAWTADGFFEYPVKDVGTFTLSAAYLRTDFGSAYKGSNPDPQILGIDGQKKGGYAKAGYLLPKKIGPGQVQPFIRYEEWKYAQLFNVFDQKIKWIGAGVNYLIDGENLRLTAQYSHTAFDKKLNPQSQDFDTVAAMLQYRF